MDVKKKWNDILEELLQCCVCLDVQVLSLAQCSKGHLICQNCKKKLVKCPVCTHEFVETKCLLAEDIISKFEDIKMSVAEEIMTKLQQCGQFVNTCTQTNFAAATKCVATQTNNTFTDGKKMDKQHYPCYIGHCKFKAFFRALLQHLIEQHMNVFYNIYQDDEVSKENFVLNVDKLPRNYDYALLLNNMNLFFLKIKIHNNGQLIANLQVVDKNIVTGLFQYRFLVTDGSYYLRRRGMVTSCLLQKETTEHSIRMDEKEMSTLIRAKEIKCTIIIKKCVQSMTVINSTLNK